jgi:hypothetical protein
MLLAAWWKAQPHSESSPKTRLGIVCVEHTRQLTSQLIRPRKIGGRGIGGFGHALKPLQFLSALRSSSCLPCGLT